MPFAKLIPHTFTHNSIRLYAPSSPGVYGISNSREWIFIGQADNIQHDLTQLLADAGSRLMGHRPTGFVFEVCSFDNRETRCRRLTGEYNPASISWRAEEYGRSS